MRLKCPNKQCRKIWDYTGSAKFQASCPACRWKVSLIEHVEEEMQELEKKSLNETYIKSSNEDKTKGEQAEYEDVLLASNTQNKAHREPIIEKEIIIKADEENEAVESQKALNIDDYEFRCGVCDELFNEEDTSIKTENGQTFIICPDCKTEYVI